MPREMKDSGIEWIGEIPSCWKIERNKNAFSCSKEIVGSQSGETQLLSLTTRGVRKKGQDVLGGKVPETFDTYQLVEENDIIMCLFDLDCSAVFSGISPYSGMISPAYKILKSKSNIIPSYADYWFSFVFVDRKFKSYAKNLRYTLTYEEFATLPIIMPPLSEQKAIADFLDRRCAEIDAVIEQTKATIEEYKKLKQSVITEAVTKGIRGDRPMKDSGIEWIGEIPSCWKIERNKNAFSCSKEIVGSQSGETQLLSLTTRGVRKKGQDVLGGKVPETFDTYQLVEENDIIMCLFDLDCSAVFSGISPYSGMISPAYKILKSKSNIIPSYADYWFSFVFVDRKFKSYAKNLRYTLTYEEFAALPIIMPPLSEQKAIADYLDQKCAEIDTLIEKKTALLAEMETYKKSLIFEYVTGKKEVC